MQAAFHMNFVKDLAHRGVSMAQWLEHRSAESAGLRFDSSCMGLGIFSLSHACDKTKHLSLFNDRCVFFILSAFEPLKIIEPMPI